MTDTTGTWLDVQDAAKKAFEINKANIDNPVYEIEKAWLSGYGVGWRAATQLLGADPQEAFDKQAAANRE